MKEIAAADTLSHTASQVIGYRKITAMLHGELSHQQAIGKVQQITRKYAKRQVTWIRRQTAFPQINLSECSPHHTVASILKLIRPSG